MGLIIRSRTIGCPTEYGIRTSKTKYNICVWRVVFSHPSSLQARLSFGHSGGGKAEIAWKRRKKQWYSSNLHHPTFSRSSNSASNSQVPIFSLLSSPLPSISLCFSLDYVSALHLFYLQISYLFPILHASSELNCGLLGVLCLSTGGVCHFIC